MDRWETTGITRYLLSIGIILFSVASAAEPSPKEIIRNLPKIDFDHQCRDNAKRGMICDYTIQNHVFKTLDSLAKRYLINGMSKAGVENIFGRPPHKGLPRYRTWRDIRYGHQIEVWTYAVTLSGTNGFFLVFVDGCLNYFDAAMVGMLPVYFGQPGTRPDLMVGEGKYLVPRESPVCSAS